MINYSIIIPHKNLPNLLTRCLDSIPERDDVQIIVVDDNSDESVVNFDEFPGQHRKSVQVIFDKSGLGAGHARNVGMKLAKGRWLVFADCDDFFDKILFNEQLDIFKDSELDLVFFKINYLDSETLVPAGFEHKVNSVFDIAKKENDCGYIRFRRNAPWAKFVRCSLVRVNQIEFQETRWSNDAWFSTQVALFAQNIQYIEASIYNYTYRENSLIKASSVEALRCRLDIALKCEGTLIKNGKGKYRPKHIEYWFYLLLKKSLRVGIGYSGRVIATLGLKGFVRGLAASVKNAFGGKR